MTNLAKSIATLCGVALLGIGLPALAQPGQGHYGHGPGPGPGMMTHMADELGLSDTQKIQLQAIMDRYHSGEFADSMKAFQAARGRLEDLIADPAATDQQILAASRLVSTQGEPIAIQRHRMATEIDAILTPDQRQKSKELKAERMSRMRGSYGPSEEPSQGE